MLANPLAMRAIATKTVLRMMSSPLRRIAIDHAPMSGIRRYMIGVSSQRRSLRQITQW
jgi:hypothetical protein